MVAELPAGPRRARGPGRLSAARARACSYRCSPRWRPRRCWPRNPPGTGSPPCGPRRGAARRRGRLEALVAVRAVLGPLEADSVVRGRRARPDPDPERVAASEPTPAGGSSTRSTASTGRACPPRTAPPGPTLQGPAARSGDEPPRRLRVRPPAPLPSIRSRPANPPSTAHLAGCSHQCLSTRRPLRARRRHGPDHEPRCRGPTAHLPGARGARQPPRPPPRDPRGRPRRPRRPDAPQRHRAPRGHAGDVQDPGRARERQHPYVASELAYLLDDADAVAAVFDARFAPTLALAAADFPTAGDGRGRRRAGGRPPTAPPEAPCPSPPTAGRPLRGGPRRLLPGAPFPPRRGDDLYFLYTGGNDRCPQGRRVDPRGRLLRPPWAAGAPGSPSADPRSWRSGAATGGCAACRPARCRTAPRSGRLPPPLRRGLRGAASVGGLRRRRDVGDHGLGSRELPGDRGDAFGGGLLEALDATDRPVGRRSCSPAARCSRRR